MTLAEELTRGLQCLGVAADVNVQRKLLDYVELVQKWNRIYNLTAVREPEQMLTHHVLDCVAVVPYLGSGPVVDVGSGAGLPGIPAALLLPKSRVTLVESSHKKSAFLRQVVIELGLGNVCVEQVRAESWRPATLFKCVASRAFADLAEFVSLAGHLCAQDGRLAAMKGVYPYDELGQLPKEYRVEDIKPITVPGLEAQRHLVLIKRVTGAQ